MESTLRIRVNKGPLLGHPVGSVVEVAAKADGSPAELFWRRRVRDAKTDGCVTVLTDEPKGETPATKRSARGGE